MIVGENFYDSRGHSKVYLGLPMNHAKHGLKNMKTTFIIT